MENDISVKLNGRFDVIRFNTSDVRRFFALQNVDEESQRCLKLRSGSFWPLFAVELVRGEDTLCDEVARSDHCLFQVAVKKVAVLLQEPVDIVGHLAGIMKKTEFITVDRFLHLIVTKSEANVVRVILEHLVHFHQQSIV